MNSVIVWENPGWMILKSWSNISYNDRYLLYLNVKIVETLCVKGNNRRKKYVVWKFGSLPVTNLRRYRFYHYS